MIEEKEDGKDMLREKSNNPNWRVGKKITYASENPTFQRVTSEKKNGKEERHTNGKVWRSKERKSLTNGKGTEKSDELKRGMQKKKRKERAAGEEKFELHLYYVIGRAGGRSWRTSAGRRRL